MTVAPVTVSDALDLLERAVSYTRLCLHDVRGELLDAPTPCTQWNLRTLLRHMDDSLAAMTDAASLGIIGLEPSVTTSSDEELVESLRTRACALIGAWTHDDGADLISVAGCPAGAGMIATAGALEILVHGWDVTRACGIVHPIPAVLSAELLAVTPQLIDPEDRPHRFAAPLAVAADATVQRRLLAALGRAA